jgi:hypothetical protein|nr:MAG TPA: hypothetical protein [Caudoviricetes sp.]
MRVTKEYRWNEVVWGELNVGDTVQLPEFTVPETAVKGDKELYFEGRKIKDTAAVYNIKDGKIYLIFNHALFTSAMDLNNATKWKKTQLRAYLEGTFKNAMRDVGVPVSNVTLLSKDRLLGEEALPFFKDGRNRTAFSDNESYSVWYWLKSTTYAAYFCYVNSDGGVYYYYASSEDGFVRPCFIVKKED